MEELFASLCEREGIAVDPIRGMGVTLGDPGKYPAPRGFRHKAATPFAPGKEGAVRCGFFERGTHKIVAVPECPVEAPGARQILNGIAREAERLHIPAFNEDKHLGLLRYAVVRCGWRTDQVMVTLVTAQRDLPHAQEFFEAVAALNPHIVTVAQNINGRPGNAILGEETRIVYGAECMRDQLLGCEFDISPTAFYQTNPQQTELLYQLAIDGMDLQQGDVLHIAFGSGMTASVQNALLAAEALREKYPERKLIVIDSLCSSSGYGLLVDGAADLRDEGKSMDEITDWVLEKRKKVHHQFYSTELKFYRRSGRMSGAAAAIGTVLGICPIMRLDEKGRIIAYDKVSGKKNAVARTVETMKRHAENGENYSGKAFICHSNCLADAEATKAAVEATFPHLNGKVRICDIGTIVASHSGPGTVAVFFFGDDRAPEGSAV